MYHNDIKRTIIDLFLATVVMLIKFIGIVFLYY